MSLSSRPDDQDRGQTEPLAALFAVAVIAVALTMYGGFVNDVLPGQSERTSAEPTLDQVWNELQNGGYYQTGDLHPLRHAYQENTNSSINATLPNNRNVHVKVTWFNNDAETRTIYGGETPGVERAQITLFDNGTSTDSLTYNPENLDSVETASRPIPIEHPRKPGIVVGGRLWVYVW